MILLICYIIGAILIGLFDTQSLVPYFSVLPIQYVLMKVALKSKNLTLSLLMVYFFIAIGVGSLLFYLDRANISYIGTNHVGDFDFSISYFFSVYGFLFVFQVVLMVVVLSFSRGKTLELSWSTVKNELSFLMSQGNVLSILPLSITAFIFGGISIWMYYQHIGMIGLHQVQLPYHLTGFLFYARRFIFTIIMIWLFAKTKNKSVAVPIMIVYSLVVAITGTSKSLNIILLFPVGLICFINRKKSLGIVAIVSSLLIYAYVTCARELIYEMDGYVPLEDVVVYSSNLFLEEITSDFMFFLNLINGFCHSLYGINNVIIAYQYNAIDFSDYLSYYTGSHMGSIISDMTYELYGVTYSADRAYGVCIGFPGTMVMLAQHNYLLLIIEAIVISFVVLVQERVIHSIFSKSYGRILKYIVVLLYLFSLMTMIEANTLMMVYICILGMLLILALANNKYSIYVK